MTIFLVCGLARVSEARAVLVRHHAGRARAAVAGATLHHAAAIARRDAVARVSPRLAGRNHSHVRADALLQMVLLPHRAVSMLVAFVRTMWRMFVTRRKNAGMGERGGTEARLSFRKSLQSAAAVVCAALGLLLLFVTPAAALPAAAIWIAAWVAAPLAAHAQSTRLAPESGLIRMIDNYLRLAARRTWSYFERYVTAEDHWLPPDNVQEYPSERSRIASRLRTKVCSCCRRSPRARVRLRPLHGLVELWENNLATWLKFDRLNGHWFNWYETTTSGVAAAVLVHRGQRQLGRLLPHSQGRHR